MAGLGLPIPNNQSAGMSAASSAPVPGPASTGVVVQHPAFRAMSLSAVQADEAEANERQNQPLITGLAGHVRWKFSIARDAKRFGNVEQRMIDNMRARRGVYGPSKLAAIQQEGGSEVFAGITGHKCRAAAAWIRDVMMSTGEDRPWSIRPSAVPDLPPEMNDLIVQQAMGPLKEQLMAASAGVAPPPDPLQTINMMSMLRDQAMSAIRAEADKRAERMASKMEDQLIEGGFLDALDEFVNDLTTFPTAILKGPVIRMRAKLQWGPNGQPIVKATLTKEWERVDPFKFYPSPAATCVDDGDMIERHRLSREDLQNLIGVPGYDDAAIRKVLLDFGGQGLNQWLFDDIEQDDAAGRPSVTVASNPDGLIDALQYWGSVQGQMLLDWGIKPEQVQDAAQEYQAESWVIGPYVIKATLNPDPLRRKPYYATSYERVPGSFWGNSVADLVRDPQDICNATARAMVNNAALSSGPQVGILADRLAPGEQVTQMRPWRIWQLNSDPMHGTAEPPITFFQPQSTMNELMPLFEKFALLADEYSGIPRYMTGDARAGGAGRTASGLSMLMSNAGKMITSVIKNIDINVVEPVLHRLYYYNMRYETDPELKGDVCIVAKGASNLVARENAQVRRNEFLAATNNPTDMAIMGVEGRAAVLRETAKTLQMDTDKVVPDIDVLRQRLLAKAALQQPDQGTPAGDGQTQNNEQTLADGAPVTDHF